MIGFLKGTIITSNRNPLILLTGNIGYVVYVPPRIFQSITTQSEQSFYIYTSVKDDAIDLYGFETLEEYDLFILLLSVSGIGPKTALAVIDRGVNLIRQAITVSDVDFFQTIPRLGKKNAQKIIIELKSKLGSTKELDLSEITSSETKELIDTLLSMGFSKPEAVAAIRKLDSTNLPFEEKLRQTLRFMGKSIK